MTLVSESDGSIGTTDLFFEKSTYVQTHLKHPSKVYHFTEKDGVHSPPNDSKEKVSR